MTRRRSKPRMGRPPLGDAKRSATIRIRVTKEFKARVDAVADAAGMTTSDWGLGLLVSALHDDTAG